MANISQMSDEELMAIAKGQKLSSMSDEELINISGQQPTGQITGQDIQEHPIKSLLRAATQPVTQSVAGTTLGQQYDKNLGATPFAMMDSLGQGKNPLAQVGAFGQSFMGGMGADIADQAQVPLNLLGGLLGKATVPAVEAGSENLAGKVINSLIKPNHKEYMFGRNPGLGIAKEGIIANNLESLGQKVSSRIGELNNAATQIRSTPENIYKTVDLTDIRNPLVKSLDKMKKTPRTNSSEISDIQNASADIEELITKLDKVGLGKLTIKDAYNVKDAVSTMQKWNRDTSVGTELNKALKQVYHSIDSKIDTAIPELKSINDRMSNLISAKQAIGRRAEVLMNQEPGPTVGKLLDLPFAAVKTTGAKTVLGRLLAKQYSLPK